MGDYKYDDNMYAVCGEECTHVGFELWQVTSGALFDDIIVTDSLEEAQTFAEETFFKKKDGEKASFDAEKEEERKKREEERKKAEEEEDSSDEDEEDFDYEDEDEEEDEF